MLKETCAQGAAIHDMYFTQIIVVSCRFHGGRKILFKRVFKGIDGESSIQDKVLHCCLANLQEFINSKRSQRCLHLSTIILRMNEVVKRLESSNRLTMASHGFYQFVCHVHTYLGRFPPCPALKAQIPTKRSTSWSFSRLLQANWAGFKDSQGTSNLCKVLGSQKRSQIGKSLDSRRCYTRFEIIYKPNDWIKLETTKWHFLKLDSASIFEAWLKVIDTSSSTSMSTILRQGS